MFELQHPIGLANANQSHGGGHRPDDDARQRERADSGSVRESSRQCCKVVSGHIIFIARFAVLIIMTLTATNQLPAFLCILRTYSFLMMTPSVFPWPVNANALGAVFPPFPPLFIGDAIHCR